MSSKKKKVKFWDEQLIKRQGAPFFLEVGTGKTSEFKSFKRLLRETGSKRDFSKLANQENLHKPDQEIAEKNDSVGCKSDEIRKSLPILKVTPIAQMSPSAKISRNSELHNGSKYKHHKSSSVLPIQNEVISWNSSLSPDLLLDCDHKYDGIFLKKRKNLLQLIAEASSYKIDEILSEKSDLIRGFLERLCGECKLRRSNKLPKLCQIAPYDYSKESQRILKTEAQSTLKRKCGKDLLEYEHSEEPDNLIGLPLDPVKTWVFPTSHAREIDLQLDHGKPQLDHGQLSRLVFDERRKSHLYARKSLESPYELENVFELPWYPTVGHTHSKADAGFASARGLPALEEYSTPDILGSSLQHNRWRSNPVLDDERFFTDSMLPKADHFVDLSQEVRWNSNSVFDGKGISENRLVSTGYHRKNHTLLKDNPLFSLPGKLMLQSFPTRHAIETGCQFKYKDFPTEERTNSGVKLGEQFECNICVSPSIDMISKPSYQIPISFPFVPYVNPFSFHDLSSSDLYSEPSQEQCARPLLQWSGNIDNSTEVEVGTLPLTLYKCPDVLDKPDAFSGIFSSSIRSPEPSIGPSRGYSQSIHSKLRFDEDQMDDGLGYINCTNRCDGWKTKKAKMDIQTHFSPDFLEDRGTFGLLNERLSWDWP